MRGKAAGVWVRLWGRSWWLAGNGPSYLLFRAEERRVLHLTRDLPRNLRNALKGYQAVENQTLVPMVRSLTLINTGLLYSPTQSDDGIRCARHSLRVLSAIQRLINKCPDEKTFAEALARLTSNIRAARRLTQAEKQFAGGDEFLLGTDDERAKFWLSDSRGRKVLIGDCANIAGAGESFRIIHDSRIAGAAQTLWDREQKSLRDRATCLYRVPTRKELREELTLDEPAVTKLCRAEGFGWLPRANVRDSQPRTGLRPSLWAA